MPLASGTRLGPYEILSAIGAGGMGEVYKARDTRLDRSVAIKVLPPDVGADADDHDLRGRYDWNTRQEGLLSRSVEFFRKAIDADPAYALAYAGLADSYNVPDLAEPYVSLGCVKHHDEWDWTAAERCYRMAIEWNEKYAVASGVLLHLTAPGSTEIATALPRRRGL
jgi:tetratricopeptide (TPR) repeat protein